MSTNSLNGANLQQLVSLLASMGLEVKAKAQPSTAQVLGIRAQRKAARNAFHNTATVEAPIVQSPNTVKRQVAVLNASVKAVETPNTEMALKVPAHVLTEARDYSTALDAAWKAWRDGGKRKELIPNDVNDNRMLTQYEVLDILGKYAPSIHSAAQINTKRGPWIWIPAASTPRHPDVKAFLKWLGFEFVGGKQNMWLHKVNHKAAGRFARGTYNLKADLVPANP